MSGRIPQNFIDDLLARVNILDIIDGRVKLKKTGKNYSGLCPFHQEKSPSFSVSPDKQFYYCFGCGAGGNAIGFLMEYERLEFPQAVEELAQLVGIDIPKESRQAPPSPEYQAQFQILDQAASYFQQQLRNHSQKAAAINYLKQRGLSGEIAQLFQLGYAPPGWDNLLQHLGSSPQQIKLLEKSGMLIRHEEKDSLYDRFRNRITFPIRDVRGRVIAFGGRVLGDDKPKYLNSPETETFHKSRELYGLYEARKLTPSLEKVIIVEGYMDVISLAQHGITYAVATLGTAATAQHLERLFKTVNEVIFCFDGDNAGRQAAARALETALPVIHDGKEAKFLFLPEGEDPDTLVRKEQQPGFEKRLDEALPLSEFFFRSFSESIDLASMDGRAMLANQVLPLIHSMPTSLLQQMMLERVSELTGLSTEQLNSTLNLTSSTGAGIQPPPAPTNPIHTTYHNTTTPAATFKRHTHSLYNQVVALLLHHPELAQKIPPHEITLLPEEPEAQLLGELLNYLHQSTASTLSHLLIDWKDNQHLSPLLFSLNQISQLDPILDSDPNPILDDAWLKILNDNQRRQLEKLQKKPFATLSKEEKQALNQLISRH